MPARARSRSNQESAPAASGRSFGDFQTPDSLARAVCRLLVARGVAPGAVLEPTCGRGSFLRAALAEFPTARVEGLEINPRYVSALRRRLRREGLDDRVHVERKNFFQVDWSARLAALDRPLVLGNPPWVTSAELGALGSDNLPTKSNFQGWKGLAARTGKSNFDISEWMLQRLLEGLAGRPGWLAMLCKTAVARKAIDHAWRREIALAGAWMWRIDAAEHFGAAVDACLLLAETAGSRPPAPPDCTVFASLSATSADQSFAARHGHLIANLAAYERWQSLARAPGVPASQPWRSGVKHDCARVMELRRDGSRFVNGLGERVALEPTYVFPMLKSSELAKGIAQPVRWMLVPQRHVGDDTAAIAERAPKTWRYLERHAGALAARASSIYRGRPAFSVFGVGDYTFAPWKVAISGFYKRLSFTALGSVAGQPIVLDDTSAFLPCRDEAEARDLAALLNSDAARQFYSAWIFWDAKRPITIELLEKLDRMALARELARPRS